MATTSKASCTPHPTRLAGDAHRPRPEQLQPPVGCHRGHGFVLREPLHHLLGVFLPGRGDRPPGEREGRARVAGVGGRVDVDTRHRVVVDLHRELGGRHPVGLVLRRPGQPEEHADDRLAVLRAPQDVGVGNFGLDGAQLERTDRADPPPGPLDHVALRVPQDTAEGDGVAALDLDGRGDDLDGRHPGGQLRRAGGDGGGRVEGGCRFLRGCAGFRRGHAASLVGTTNRRGRPRRRASRAAGHQQGEHQEIGGGTRHRFNSGQGPRRGRKATLQLVHPIRAGEPDD